MAKNPRASNKHSIGLGIELWATFILFQKSQASLPVNRRHGATLFVLYFQENNDMFSLCFMLHYNYLLAVYCKFTEDLPRWNENVKIRKIHFEI